MPVLRGEPRAGHETLYWEHEGGRAVRQGDWKLAALPDAEWELFDLARDRTESRDVSAHHPEKVRDLVALWTAWRERMSQAAKEAEVSRDETRDDSRSGGNAGRPVRIAPRPDPR